jgi:Na+/H+ antiporter NhaD/arsenite permease-like protein
MITALITINLAGYLAILLEKNIRINKTAISLIMGACSWLLLFSVHPAEKVTTELAHHLSDISEILFFLLGAMTIVEVMDAHNAFDPISNIIAKTSTRKSIVLICIITFFLSGIIDNLTSTIVMIMISRKLFTEKSTRLTVAGIIIISSNAGGAWSPIGDITTSMLWIGGQITALPTISRLFFPSLISALLPALILMNGIKNNSRPASIADEPSLTASNPFSALFLIMGLLGFLAVPLGKWYFNAPPYLCMLIVLGIIWLTTEWIQKRKSFTQPGITVENALQKIDSSSILFFLGILLAVAALDSAGILNTLSQNLQSGGIASEYICLISGIISAVIDNVPLLAAMQKMFDPMLYPTDNFFWHVLAYCIGTGGSILIIGSAAGIVAMGMEKMDFFWYLKKISWLALLGYIAGFLTLMIIH